MADPVDMSGVFAKAAADQASGKIRYTRDGKPYTVPSYSDLEPQRQAYAAGAQARATEELGQRMRQMNAVDRQQGRALRFPDAGMPKPGTFEAPTDFRTPVKTVPPAPRFTLPQMPNVPRSSEKLSGLGGKLANTLAPVATALTLAQQVLEGAQGTARFLGDVPSFQKGLQDDAAAAGGDFGKYVNLRRDRQESQPHPFTPLDLFDKAIGSLPFIPRKRSSNLPDYLEPRGQRIPVGTFPTGTVFVVTFSSPGRTDVFRVRDLTEASVRREEPGTGFGAYIYVLKGSDTNFEQRIFNETQPSISTAIEPVGGGAPEPVPTPTGEPSQAGDTPSIPQTITPFDPGDLPTPAPKPAPRKKPTPQQAPTLQAVPTPAPRREPSRAPAPAPANNPAPAPANQAQATPAPAPQSTPGQAPSPSGGGGALRAPSLNPDRFPDTKIGNQNEPLRAPSLNPEKFPDPAPSQQPDPRSPDSPNTAPTPTIDPAPQPQPDPGSQKPNTPQKLKRCDDPCIAEMQAEQGNNKPVEIKVKIFKACKTTPTETDETPNGNESEKAIYEEKTIKVPSLEADTYKLLYERIAKLEALQCEQSDDCVAAVPEWWQVRVGQRPQLVVLYAEVQKDGKLGNSRWAMTIPHYSKKNTYKPSFPTYNKGDFEGMLRLADNSNIIVNASTAAECKRVLNALKQFLPQPMLKGSTMKVGQRFGMDFKKVKVTAVSAKFFSNGQHNAKPDWTINLKKK